MSEVGDLSFACAQLKEVKEVENCYLKRSSIVRRLWMEDRYLPGFISSNHWDIWKFNGNGTLFSIFADFSNEIITWIGLPYIGRKAEICKLFVLNLTFFMRFSTKRWHKRDWWIITMMSCKSEDIRCRCQSSNPDYGLCREWRVAAQTSCRTYSERLWYSSFPISPQQDKYYGHW